MQGHGDSLATVDGNGLPREVSTAEAAKILGVSKDMVLKLKDAGLLEYRNYGTTDQLQARLRLLLEVRPDISARLTR